MRKKILLVDDDQVFHFINTKMIERAGVECEIRIASNGIEALDTISGGSTNPFIPDCIFVDVNMPGMNGFDFVQKFLTSDLPGIEKITIVMLTSSNSKYDHYRATELAITNFFVKPLSEMDLAKILHA